MFNRKLIKNFDFWLLLDVLVICALSIVVISSASHAIETGSFKKVIIQLVAVLAGLISIFILTLFDYNQFARLSTFIYIANIIILALVLFMGKTSNGAQSWISLGQIDIQPSEFSKIAIILTLANKFKDIDTIRTFRELISPIIHVGIPFIIVILQPDLGTAMVFVAIFIGMLFMSGVKTKIFAGLITAGLAMMPIAYKVLKPYQRKRLLSFINPALDPQNSGYHVIQSKIAIGSGLFWGKGLYNGSQTQLYYLPEAWTDFIFSVVGEELGFIGASLLIILYAVMLYKCWKIAFMAKDKYGRLVAVGIISMFLFHIFENIGMTVGIMPITGIPLPFMSYGGSSVFANMLALGLLLNIGMRRRKINF